MGRHLVGENGARAGRLDGRDGDSFPIVAICAWRDHVGHQLQSPVAFSKGMFLDALLQFDPRQEQLNANVRFNLIHHPLSDLYIVYNEARVIDPTDPRPTGRSIIVKVTQTLAF